MIVVPRNQMRNASCRIRQERQGRTALMDTTTSAEIVSSSCPATVLAIPGMLRHNIAHFFTTKDCPHRKMFSVEYVKVDLSEKLARAREETHFV